MKKIKEVWSLIKKNLWTLVGFESLFKILSFLIFTPLFLNLFKVITKITGYKYLTYENIKSFLLNPITLIMLLILIMLMMVYTVFDIATIIVILDASYQKKKIKITEAIATGLKKCCSVFHLKNISLAFLVLFLIPFLHVGISSSFISTIKIPEFIYEYILSNKILLILLIGLICILLSILLKWIYAIHYFILENKTFKEARECSKNLSYHSHAKDLLTLTLVQLGMTLFYFLFIMFGIGIILLIGKLFDKIIIIKSLSITIIWIFLALSMIIFLVLSTPISYATISIMYYLKKDKKKEKIKHIKLQEKNNFKSEWIKKTIGILGVIAIIFGTYFTYGLYKGKFNFNIEYARVMEVTAHRGASVEYPENTMAAFVGAKALGADWIELDVQQSKDGYIFVQHDTNFKRTTGINKNTWELTLDEIKQLDAGKLFKEKFTNEKIPTLEEVIIYAKENNIKLNIELKPTGHETDFEKNVLDIINKYQFANDCVITSQVYDVLEKVKEYSENVKTVYVMSLAYGDILSLDKADYFSIEASSINKPLVKKIHNAGKELYVWTVNTEENILKMIDLNVDNIITDNIDLAKETIYKSKTSNVIKVYIDAINDLFK